MAPLVEELIFRGYIYTVLERLWGVAPAVLLSGVLFGSIHFPQLWPGYFQMFLLCVVGVVFSLARARTGTTLASVALHFGYNAAISLLFLFSENFRDLPGPF
jgi:membrane protease YdiL (CAAX protease family)